MLKRIASNYLKVVLLIAVVAALLMFPGSVVSAHKERPNSPPPIVVSYITPCGGDACADGFYDEPNWDYLFAGARNYMNSAEPQIRNNGYSAMRVWALHDPMGYQNNDRAFVEGGWVKWPSKYGTQSRFVYGSARDTAGNYYEGTYDQLADGHYDRYWYRVSVNPSDQNDWVFKFNTVRKADVYPGFSRTADVGCGGESTGGSAIGIDSCQSVAYWQDDLGPWPTVPSHQKRVTTGYNVSDINANTWQVSGQN